MGVSERELAKIEDDEANPTVATLTRVTAPFGMRVGFVRPIAGLPVLEPSFTPEQLDAMTARVLAALLQRRVRRGKEA